jgi:hypothetical protein
MVDGKHFAGNLEIFDRAGERERIWRRDYARGLHADEGAFVEDLRVDDGGVDFYVAVAEVAAVGGESVGDDTFADLFLAEGNDPLVFF